MSHKTEHGHVRALGVIVPLAEVAWTRQCLGSTFDLGCVSAPLVLGQFENASPDGGGGDGGGEGSKGEGGVDRGGDGGGGGGFSFRNSDPLPSLCSRHLSQQRQPTKTT